MLVVEVTDDVDRMALQRRQFRLRRDVDEVDRRGIDIGRLGEGWPHDPRRIAGRIADLMAGEILWAVHTVGFQPVKRLSRIRVDAHDGDDVGAFAARDQSRRQVGDPEGRAVGADALRRHARAFADFNRQIDAGLLIELLSLGIIEWRMVRRRRPVEQQSDVLGRPRGAG